MPRRIMAQHQRRHRFQILLTDDENAMLRDAAEIMDVVPGVYGRHLMLSALKNDMPNIDATRKLKELVARGNPEVTKMLEELATE